MTSFGGMYSVRGYDEYEIVADGGFLASIQYELNWFRYKQMKDSKKLSAEETEQTQEDEQSQDGTNENIFTKLVPLVFMDYGRTDIVDPVLGENDNQTLLSVGIGSSFEIKKNLSGAIYYGCPLKDTQDTDKGHGKINLSFMLRW
jgi:hemolysin activation/secretion protein